MWERELDWQTKWEPANIVLLEELSPEGTEKRSGAVREREVGKLSFRQAKARQREDLSDSKGRFSDRESLEQDFPAGNLSGQRLPERNISAQGFSEGDFTEQSLPEKGFSKKDFSEKDLPKKDFTAREVSGQDSQKENGPDENLPQDVPQGTARDGQAKKSPGRQLYPAMRKAAASYPPPRVNTGEEHMLFVQIVLCALILAFSWFARSADAPFLPQLQTEFETMLSTGVEFSTDNTFARFADSVVEQLRAGTRRLLEKLEEPEAMEDGMGGIWLTVQGRTVPDGATLEEYTLPVELQYPVSGYLTSPYGFRDNPVNGEDDFHAGIDIGAAEGTPVLAAQSGIVMRTGYTRLRGYYIILRHAGGVQTLYQHLSYIFVRGGERVEQGQLIADVGSTGFVTGPHLHLELIVDGVRVDPLPTFPRYIVE